MRGALSQRADVKQLDEAKKTLEFELEEIKTQLERDGYTSVAQMRCVVFSISYRLPDDVWCRRYAYLSFCSSSARSALQRLQQENQALQESQVRAGVAGLGTNAKKSLSPEEEEEEEKEEEEEEGEEEEEEDTEEEDEQKPSPAGKRGPPCVSLSNEPGKRRCMRPCSLNLGILTSHHLPHQPEAVSHYSTIILYCFISLHV